MKRYGLRWALLAALVGVAAAQADVKLPKVFGSRMVLQRDAKLPFWGWADAGEPVSVKLGDGAAVTATTGQDGKWKLELPPTAAGGPFTVTVQGKNTITLDDVLVGEVWLCSGQSNMQMTVVSCLNWEAEKAAGDHPQIRQLGVPLVPAPFPTDDLPGEPKWTICTPDTVGGFTACGYFMARELQKQLNVPVGLLNSSWGGTLIEPWIPPVGYAAVPEVKSWLDRVLLADPHTEPYKTTLSGYLAQVDAWSAKAKAALAAEGVLDPAPAYPGGLRPITDQVADGKHQQPTALYNDMIHPLVPYAMRGAIWYQGESNRWDGMLYAAKMQALIRGWRQLWGQGDFPFYYVQIAPFHYGDQPPTKLPEFWEAQAALLGREPNTGEVVTNDIGELPDIHPRNKQEVGRRLALLALHNTYGQQDLLCEGPIFKSMKIDGGKVRLEFDNVGSGLASRDGKPLDWFRIIGTDTGWLDATAEIDGNAVVVSSPDVKEAAAVTFGWTELAMPNLMNKEGLPARPFRCGEVPDTMVARAPESKGYTLVFDLDLAKLGANPAYDVDHHTQVGKYDRVAYFLELQKPGGEVQFVYVSMDAFTDDPTRIGIPTVLSKANFQQPVANATVVSNVAGIVGGTGLATCNIEFWPNNYGPTNTSGVANADNGKWDFGDQCVDPVDGYGCLQVHNFGAKQTLFAINQWKGGAGADLGIGNSSGTPNDTRDWTFAKNAGDYSLKRLRVLVREVK